MEQPSSKGAASTDIITQTPTKPLVLLFGGDVDFSRALGKVLLSQKDFDPFVSANKLFRSADLVFANLECTLSDQSGETGKPGSLVFTGPGVGADLLKKNGFDVVSTANNHAWDYGEKALKETLQNLDRVGIKHCGTGPTIQQAWLPAIVEKNHRKIAFLAVTDIWNQGALAKHVAKEFVADANDERLKEKIQQVKDTEKPDLLVVSYHGGEEYNSTTHQRAKRLFREMIDAGADMVVGHHPHVAQGVEFYRDKPLFYSLGNLRFGMHSDHADTGMGLTARITVQDSAIVKLELCPVFMHLYSTVSLSEHPKRNVLEIEAKNHITRLIKSVDTSQQPIRVVSSSEGCFEVAK